MKENLSYESIVLFAIGLLMLYKMYSWMGTITKMDVSDDSTLVAAAKAKRSFIYSLGFLLTYSIILLILN